MTSLADLPELIGFFSYSREDDQDSHSALSTIRTLIQNELRARLGRSRQSLRLWQDQEAIAPGSMWESQIDSAVQQSVFFIPIITPRVINSKYCSIEFKRFLDRERELRRNDLLFPILYIDVDELQDEKQWRGHPILEVIGQRQYVDWREYRYEPLDSPTLRRAAANLCAQIVTTLRRPQPNERTDVDNSAAARRETDRVAREHAEKERQRDEEKERLRNEEAELIRREEENKRRASAKEQLVPLKQEDSPSDEERSRLEKPREVADPVLLESSTGATQWGIAGAVAGVLGWVLSYSTAGSVPQTAVIFINDLLLGLATALMLYRSALGLGRASGAGAAITVSRYLISLALSPIIGLASYLISPVTYVVPAIFDPRLRTWSLLLKVLAVAFVAGLVAIVILNGSLRSQPLLRFNLNWLSTILSQGIIFGLFGHEIAKRRSKVESRLVLNSVPDKPDV